MPCGPPIHGHGVRKVTQSDATFWSLKPKWLGLQTSSCEKFNVRKERRGHFLLMRGSFKVAVTCQILDLEVSKLLVVQLPCLSPGHGKLLPEALAPEPTGEAPSLQTPPSFLDFGAFLSWRT